MSRLFKASSKTSGYPPGTLIHVGEKRTEKINMTLISYDENQIEEKQMEEFGEKFSIVKVNSLTGLFLTVFIKVRSLKM